MADVSALAAFLDDHVVGEAHCPRPIIIVDSPHVHIVEVFKLLTKHKLSAVPVQAEDGASFLGYVSTADIVQHMVDFCRPAEGVYRKQVSFADFLEQLAIEEVVTVVNAAHKQPFVSVTPTATLHQVLELLAAQHVDRLCVQEKPSEILDVITQQHIIKLLAKNVTTLAPSLQGTVGSTKLGIKPVFSVRHDASMLEALQVIADKRISAVGVLGQNHELLTTLSTTDIRAAFNHEKGNFFNLTALGLVQMSRLMQIKDSPGILVAHPSTTLIDVVRKLAATGRHRLFVTEEHSKVPIGVISLTDLCQYLLTTFKEHL